MEDSVIRIPRQSCCRLCLAPDSECVSIFGTRAADKQPISVKIQSCVNIQVNASDRLSGKICHGCISFLNSWTSFKGRCVAAQRQQKSWLAGQLKRQLGLQASTEDGELENGDGGGESKPQPMDEDDTAAYNYYPRYNKKGGVKGNAPRDDEDAGPVTVNMELDPAQFLVGGGEDDDDDAEEDDDELEEGEFVEPMARMKAAQSSHKSNSNNNNAPQILNALGLRNVNPMSMLATDLLMNQDDIDDEDESVGTGGGVSATGTVPGAQCRVCAMEFSNRANARRHERNLHGLKPPHSEAGLNDSNSNSNASNTVTNGQFGVAAATASQSSATSTNNSAATTALSVARRSVDRAPPREVFDYSKPEKYRHLMTEARVLFIRRNARFLHQYQDMTCKCCDRKYFTYKTFMAHMRKKYPTLPRNVCFNCLRKFETKGQFIAHLKKRNCMNMFTLFMADETIPKDSRLLCQAGLMGSSTGDNRMGLKDLLSNKMYACRICQEQLRLKNEFRQHVVAAHPDMQNCRDPVTGNCRQCLASFTDVAERKRHFSAMDCMVVIICTTCDNQFTTNAKFLDHVYGTHLKELNAADQKAAQLNTEKLIAAEQEIALGKFEEAERQSGGRGAHHSQLMPKKNAGCVCPICQKQYNNYYNVLWHFESKHPEHVPKTYKCEICEAMFTKQQLLKSHVKELHGDALTATSPGKDGQGEGGAAAAVGSYPCRHCDVVLGKATEYVAHLLKVHPDEELLACHECEFVTEEREKIEEHLRVQHLNLLKLRVLSCSQCKQSFVTEDALKYHTMVQHAENESSEQLFKRMLKMGKFPKVERKAEGEFPDEDNDLGGDDGDDELLQDTSFMARVKYEESQRVRECPVCVEKYTVLAEFIEHMNVHVAQDNVTNLDLEPGKSKSGAYHSRMRCRMCEKRISSKVGYKRHLLEEHGVNDCKIVQCDLCPGEFSNDKGLKVHLFRTHNICVKEDGEVVTGMQVLPPTTGDSQLAAVAAQLAIKQETIEYECQICHTVYRSLGLLKSHVGSVHQMNDFEAYLLQHGNGEIITPHAAAGDDPQQQQLDAMSLMMMSGLMDGDEPGTTGGATDYTPIEVYFQCRYCDENFASRQKLTAHMNTHEEHDPTDYTCRECGNVYQSRKSLWVHRNKKHPRSQVPSPCEVCKKVFFDKTELVYHLKTHVAQKMELMNELMSAAQNGGMEDEDVEDSASEGEENGAGGEGLENGVNGAKKYDCHVCERKFRDAGKLSQHLRFHEMQNNMFVLGAFTEAGMDDEGGDGSGNGGGMNGGGNEGAGDPFEPQYNDDGTEEYQCDMCPKKFSQLMALRVHRGWHYRSPDGRQITEPGQTWQPGSLRSQRGSKGGSGAVSRNSTTGTVQPTAVAAAAIVATAVEQLNRNNNNSISSNNNHHSTGMSPKLPKCQFCSSTFASSNNLRRHIVEVHKRNDFRASAGGVGTGSGPKVKSQGGNSSGSTGGFVDRDRECQACSLTFETRAEWAEHKIGHAKVMRPSTTFEWNCEMCGKVFTRKERLLQHMASHATEDTERQGGGGRSMGDSGSENSQGTIDNDRSRDGQDLVEEEDLEDEDEPMVVNPDVEMLNEDDDDEDEDGMDDEEDGEYVQASQTLAQSETVDGATKKDKHAVASGGKEKNKSLCCDLCQLAFTDAGELRKHVLSHFFNGQGEGVPSTAAAVAKKKEERKESTAAKVDEEGPQAKKPKIDIPDNDDQFDEDEEEEGEYVQAQSRLDGTLGADLTAGDSVLNEGGGEDLDEGEYVEEYFDEDSFVSPKKVTPPKTAGAGMAPAVASCRLCSSAFENNFKALKCMESHRQRSKFQCQECELYFGTPKQLSGHQQLMHPGA